MLKLTTTILTTTAIAFLGACHPISSMKPEEVAQLSDDQICDYENRISNNEFVVLEIGKRNLNCDPFHRACLAKGLKPKTSAINICTDQLKENDRLQGKLGIKELLLQYERSRQVEEHNTRYCNDFPFC